jgi:hypothetical protein
MLLVALAGCSNNVVMDHISRAEDFEKTEITYKPVGATFSSQQLRIIPVDPMFTPSPEDQERALGRLASRFGKHEITSTLFKEVQFIDPGQNFETITCRQCGRPIEIEDWQVLMSTAQELNFTDLSIVTPCCNKPSNLNNLEYQSASGFARYVLTVMDPSEDAGKDLLPLLEGTFRTKLKLVHAKV